MVMTLVSKARTGTAIEEIRPVSTESDGIHPSRPQPRVVSIADTPRAVEPGRSLARQARAHDVRRAACGAVGH
jgi:hypothetical protein